MIESTYQCTVPASPRRVRLALMLGLVFGSGALAPTHVSSQEAAVVWPAELPAIHNERLPNGLRVIHLPPVLGNVEGTDSVDITFGYAIGLRARNGYDPGAPAVTSAYLASSIPARRVALAAHLSGGSFEVVDDAELVGMRLTVPRTAVDYVVAEIAMYFSERALDPRILNHAQRLVLEREGRQPVEPLGEIREAVGAALLGDDARLLAGFGLSPSFDGFEPNRYLRYFRAQFGTDRGYVLASQEIGERGLGALRAIPARTSAYASPLDSTSDSDSLSLEFPSRPEGGVIIATSIPSVHFEDWFDSLVADQVLRNSMELQGRMTLGRSLESSFHWIEVPVRIPDFPEEARDRVIERLLEFGNNPDTQVVGTSKQEALAYLAAREVREWFAAHGLSETLGSEWNRIWNMSPADVASAVQRFAVRRRVTATWLPAFSPPAVVVAAIGGASVEPEPRETPEPQRAPGRVRVPAIAQTSSADSEAIRLERLDSGVTLAPSDGRGVFIAGSFEGTLPDGRLEAEGETGELWLFQSPIEDNALARLQDVRPDRLLFLVPVEELPAARERFRDWTSGRTDSTASLAAGEVATIDMPGILVLKTWLEAKVIEAGWHGQLDLRVEGIQGARLVIDADPQRAAEVQVWIESVASDGLSETEFFQVRAAAVGYFARIRRELQIILWQRAPDGVIQSPDTVTRQRLQDVARLYF